MTEYLSAARSILALGQEEDSWDFIKDRYKCFIWTDDDSVQQWNEIAKRSKLSSVQQRIDAAAKGEREFLTYKGKTVEAPLTHSRDDRLIIIHTLGRLVRNDSDIRFCVDSFHSSNLAFLALSPGDWKALEKEFGKKAIAYRFLPLGEDIDMFVDQAFSDENNRHYASATPDASAEEQMARELADQIKELTRPDSPSSKVACELELVSARVLRLIIETKTDEERDALAANRKCIKQIVDAATKRCAEHKIDLSIAYVQSHESVNRDFGGDWSIGWLGGHKMV